MNIFDINTRKIYQKFIVDITSKLFLYFINNNLIAGYLVLFIHTFFGIFLIYNLMIREINILYYIYTIIWILVIYSNYYFHGCILVRIEQSFFQDKKWNGPINMLFYFLHLFYKPNKDILNDFIKYFICAPISTIIILKYIFDHSNINNFIGIILMTILIPLLFIYSQCNIFDFFFQLKSPYKHITYNFTKFNNKVIAITGCSSGIGKNIVYNLINNSNAKLILLNHNSKNKEELYETLKNNKNVIHINCDLSNYKKVIEAYQNIVKLIPEGIDVLINNGGIYNTNNQITVDGYNNQIQTNFISHALLIELFLKNIKNKNRHFEIVNVSSIAYNIPHKKIDQSYFNKINVLNNLQNNYNGQIYYQQSKLALLLYTNYLNTKIQKYKNKNIKIFCVHPGICNTNLLNKTNIACILKYFGNTIDNSSNFILNMILNNNVKSNNFNGINIFNNSIETIENKELINNICSKKLYLQIKNIIKHLI